VAWLALAQGQTLNRGVYEQGTNTISGAKFFLNGLWIGTNAQVTVNVSNQLVSVVNGVTNLLGGASTSTNDVNGLWWANAATGTVANASNWSGSGALSNFFATSFYPVNNPSNFTTLAQVWSAGALSNNWTGGAIVLDAANANTNTFGGALVIGPARYQANGSTASGKGSWANYSSTASGEGSWANFYSTASGEGSWANYNGTASGAGSWANANGTASGEGSWAMGLGAEATNNETFVWSDSTAIGSTTNKQWSTYASNGYRLLGGPITGNGSGVSNVNALTLGGVAAGGYVQTQELTNASNTLWQATASKANSNSVVTVVQTNSAGVAVTNQFTIGDANPTIVLPTISAAGGGGGITNLTMVLLARSADILSSSTATPDYPYSKGIVFQATNDTAHFDVNFPRYYTLTGQTSQVRSHWWIPNASTATGLVELGFILASGQNPTNPAAPTLLTTNTVVGSGVSNNLYWTPAVNVPLIFTNDVSVIMRMRYLSGNTGICTKVEIIP
jgi:hypothetical protein